MIKNNVKQCFVFFKKFIGLLTGIVNASNHTKCKSLSNQKYTTQPTLYNSQRNEYTHGLRYDPSAVNLDRCVGNCNTLNDLSNKVYVPNKTEDLNSTVFNMIAGIRTESETFIDFILFIIYSRLKNSS